MGEERKTESGHKMNEWIRKEMKKHGMVEYGHVDG
jgi:hypothetical protein